jgi:enterochelin esterase-like enzyme
VAEAGPGQTPDGRNDPLADGNYKIAPPYKDAPELTVKDGVPRGKMHEFYMDSKNSKFYPGVKGAYKRKVLVYVPAQYVQNTEVPFIVVHDGDGKTVKNAIPKLLDNMIHDKRLPVMIAVLLHHGGGDGPGSERGLEYDTLSEKYAVFIETEVLPKIETDYKIKFTKNPEGRATLGGSSGAACAFTMAWYRPDLYRRVISYSGTYVNQQSPKSKETPHGAWEFHENLIPKSEKKPIRVWLHVSEQDNGAKSNEKSMRNWVMANDRMADVLKAKGYHYRYVFSGDSKHVDSRVLNQTLPDAFLYVWQDYKAK